MNTKSVYGILCFFLFMFEEIHAAPGDDPSYEKHSSVRTSSLSGGTGVPEFLAIRYTSRQPIISLLELS